MGFDPESVKGRYLDDLLDQPRALRATWNRLKDDAVFEQIASACAASEFDRVVLTGMGGSFFGFHPLSIELAEHGWTPMMIETSELIHFYPQLLTPRSLVIAVSQSGRSAETVRLLEMNRGSATVIGVTNDASSPLGTEAMFPVLMAAGEEYSVSCKTYVSTLLALNVIGTALCGVERVERLRDLESAPDVAEVYLRNWKSHAAELVELLSGVKDVFLVGRGVSMAAAQAGALIMKESAHVHAEGMSSAAFRHGPFEMLRPDMFVGVFAGDARTRALNEQLLKDVRGTGARAALFAQDAELAACRLQDVPSALMPIAEILPAQMMTLALAALRGREPGKFERVSKITATE
ncbi:SIS domain-containing protein [Occallatibacter riparius]|uniref:Glutamine--fructose-6-phosphate aminotransferase [isomerizing] n=1 Tax=Occallatibacter riparius TaxID=1002689 RepID=A0A9J7BR44_9BACT|nr:SIS domain-containing protein [Occallatibacter riparius]UWZ84218.1 SIS domain-containing protein [Occallatibacter riparius]